MPAVTHIFEIFIAVLGISAAIWGGWLEHAGPRKAGIISAICWGGGLVLRRHWRLDPSALARLSRAAVICGVGQGLGYITPVSTLIKWFPDRRGMATGFAIMGYGGGAMIGAPLAVWLMAHFASNGVPGVAPALDRHGRDLFHRHGRWRVRLPRRAQRMAPAGWTPPPQTGQGDDHAQHVHLNASWQTPQFWLIWGVLCLNVTAGIARDLDGEPDAAGRVRRQAAGRRHHRGADHAQKAAIVAAAAGLVGLISLFNSSRPHLLGLPVGQDRPQEHVLHDLS